MSSAYGEHWEKVKKYVNDKGWCKIIPDENIFPGTCGMVAREYQVKSLEPNTNYMGWSHFRPKKLMCLDLNS
tara:strand:- start:15 stop:230 length:216 start_codon:yes stop_codon:yes gene_type:complete